MPRKGQLKKDAKRKVAVFRLTAKTRRIMRQRARAYTDGDVSQLLTQAILHFEDLPKKVLRAIKDEPRESKV